MSDPVDDIHGETTRRRLRLPIDQRTQAHLTHWKWVIGIAVGLVGAGAGAATLYYGKFTKIITVPQVAARVEETRVRVEKLEAHLAVHDEAISTIKNDISSSRNEILILRQQEYYNGLALGAKLAAPPSRLPPPHR